MLNALLGTQLEERYRLDQLIGEGATAWVFAGHDARLARDVAVKVLKPQESSDREELQDRFVLEGRTLAKFVHPNVVPIYDAGLTRDGFGFLVMELCQAGTLEAELFRRKRLGAQEAVELLLPLLGAIACAHDRGIVHRDIKPANIVLASENGERCAKLLDFGIAKRADSASTDSASGTPSYMAPEQATGSRPSAAADVWSMGVVFFRCLSGSLPFVGETPFSALQKLVTERAPRFADACPALGRNLALALDRALEPSPSRRYCDMRSFAQALTAACAQDGTSLTTTLGEAPGFMVAGTRHVPAVVERTRPLGERKSVGASNRDSTVRTFRCFSNVKVTEAPDSWAALRARIDVTPSDAMVRGMFFNELLRTAPGASTETRRYVPFSFYPVRDYMSLILQVAEAQRDELSPATKVLRAGCGVYSLFSSSLAGTAIFSIARDFRGVVALASKAYNVTLKPGHCEVSMLSDGEALVRLRQVWPFPDIFHAGIWLGGLEAFDSEGEIEVTRYSLCDVDFLVRWSRRT